MFPHRLVACLLCAALLVAALAEGSGRDRAPGAADDLAAAGSPVPAAAVSETAGDDIEDLVAWALGRFARLGLPVPDAAAVVAVMEDGCSGRRAWVSFAGDETVVALCGDLEIRCAGFRGVEVLTEDAKRCLLHELSHVWMEEHVDADARDRFMAFTGAAAWDDPALPWHARGVEQAAETLAWGLRCEPTVTPSGTTAACRRRSDGFEILTGRRPTVDCDRCLPLPDLPR